MMTIIATPTSRAEGNTRGADNTMIFIGIGIIALIIGAALAIMRKKK